MARRRRTVRRSDSGFNIRRLLSALLSHCGQMTCLGRLSSNEHQRHIVARLYRATKA